MGRYLAFAKLFCVALFLMGCAGVAGYQIFWKVPGERCEAAGRWWLESHRACGIPITISDITGRPLPPGARSAIPTSVKNP